jgi:hypothetical protein
MDRDGAAGTVLVGNGPHALALLADLFPWWRERVFAVFNRLERTPREGSMNVPNRVAA